ncbi:hypothetical protein EIP91_009453 [Steccherinum ochraceum]|uniref:SAP domain-containing protein n=1 Tax=Steccherinum ochraceum TaxID=92696 RepID=A0A4R0RP50_9APHY|nr:hypothetical protein EIP91_009453 [Steccherinum ochraceum]
MLRAVARRAQLQPVAGASCRRTFVSTVLLTRSWENDTVLTLRQEAKNRGLSQKGNKATLITRLQEYDQHNPMQHVTTPATPPTPILRQTRLASTTEVPGVPSSAEPYTPPPSYPKISLDVIPDASQPTPEPSVQIPFVPDFWESSRVKAAEQPPEGAVDAEVPNLIAVAGDATHISASPSHNLYTGLEDPSDQAPVKSSKDKTFLQEIAEDVFIPTSWPKAESESVQENYRSRPLNSEERSGLWAFLGIVVGSFVGAAVLESPSKFASEAEKAKEEAASAATAKH